MRALNVEWPAIAAVLVGSMFLSASAGAATITVNDTGDSSGGRGCTLRDAIRAANTDTAQGGCTAGSGADAIEFNVPLPSTIKLTTNTELTISSDVTILGPGATSLTVDGHMTTRVFDITAGTTNVSGLTIKHGITAPSANGGGIFNGNGATLNLTDCALSGNSAGSGGGIYNDGGTLTLTNCTLSGNKVSGTSGWGGGIYNHGGTLSLTNCTLSGNKASGTSGGWGGGGISNLLGVVTLTNCTLSGNSVVKAGWGGAIFNAGTLTVTNSTFSGNSAGYGGWGGAINNRGTLTLTNCTLSGNSVVNAGWGGGIYIDRGTLILTNCTLSGNKISGTSGWGGGIGIDGPSSTTIANTIIAHSQSAGGDCVNGGGGVTDNGRNLTQDSAHNCGLTGAPGDLTATDPLLLPLAKNGSGTKTMALCTGVGTPKSSCTGKSPAIDAGDNAQCPTVDQRGLLRITGADTICDIGAFEGP
jgi:hypothetical protein